MALNLEALKVLLNEIDDDVNALHRPELSFFRSWLEAKGLVLPDDESEDEEESEPPPDVEGADEETAKARNVSGTTKIDHLNRAIQLDPTSHRRFAERGEAFLDIQDYDGAIEDAERALEMQPESVKALRLKANAAWMKNDTSRAYFALCDAQRIDYSDEYDTLHRQIKEALDKENSTPTPPPPAPQIPSAGLDMNAFMQSPAVQQMAQNLMQNPELMQQMMGAFKNGNPPI